MKKVLIISISCLLVAVGLCFADNLITPRTSGDNLGTSAKPFGIVYGNTLLLTGIPTSTNGFTTTGQVWANSGALTIYTAP